jgi:hypothetical protein
VNTDIKKRPTTPFIIKEDQWRERKKQRSRLKKNMAMGPSGARCQEWPCRLIVGSKLLVCSAEIIIVSWDGSWMIEKKWQLESTVQLSLEGQPVKRRLHVCCSYIETGIITVEIRCQDTISEDWENYYVCVTVNSEVCRSAVLLAVTSWAYKSGQWIQFISRL